MPVFLHEHILKLIIYIFAQFIVFMQGGATEQFIKIASEANNFFYFLDNLKEINKLIQPT